MPRQGMGPLQLDLIMMVGTVQPNLTVPVPLVPRVYSSVGPAIPLCFPKLGLHQFLSVCHVPALVQKPSAPSGAHVCVR